MALEGSTRLTAFDAVGLAVGAFGLLCAAAAVVKVAPIFDKMFADFGHDLPALTRLFLTPWFLFALGVLPLTVVAVGILRNVTRPMRAALMGIAILITLALPGIFL